MRTPVEQNLLHTLIELEDAVKAAKKIDLLALFSRIDEQAKQLPPESDPQLRHFLQRKSYQKAKALLENM